MGNYAEQRRDDWEKHSKDEQSRHDYLKQQADQYTQTREALMEKAKLFSPSQEESPLAIYYDKETSQVHRLPESKVFELIQKEQQKHYEEKERARADKNPDFIQLQKGIAPEVIASIAGESAVAIQVLMFFFKNMDKSGVLVVSQTLIAETIGKTRQGVIKALKVLEKHKAIGTARVGGGNNVYIVNPEVAWQKANRDRKILVTKGVVMLSQSENEKLFEQFGQINNSENYQSLAIKTTSTKIARSTPTETPSKSENKSESADPQDGTLDSAPDGNQMALEDYED
jgi:hypothetical protein